MTLYIQTLTSDFEHKYIYLHDILIIWNVIQSDIEIDTKP